MARLGSANCGNVWAQTFSYDAFGNISKSGSITFEPGYTPLKNRFLAAYDNNGNLTNDGHHAYSWDANSRPLTIDTVAITYDALGRMAEQNKDGAYTQFVYTPTGAKLATMSGQTLQEATVKLPSGAAAVYKSSGLAYYRHADWLGSARLATTPSRTVHSDQAYAPFGESYAQSGNDEPVFTGKTQDTVAGLYDFPAREYSPAQGRWISPDPAGLGAAHPENPQSWNRYAYVLNNPLALIDPNGHDCVYDENGSMLIKKGDCFSDTDAGYYFDCNGCLYNAQLVWFQVLPDGNLYAGYWNSNSENPSSAPPYEYVNTALLNELGARAGAAQGMIGLFGTPYLAGAGAVCLGTGPCVASGLIGLQLLETISPEFEEETLKGPPNVGHTDPAEYLHETGQRGLEGNAPGSGSAPPPLPPLPPLPPMAP